MKYSDDNRGKIQNRERAKQLIDYCEMRQGNITPSNIDGFFEKGDKIFVFYEYKLLGAEMPKGQRLGLMRIVDGLTTAGKSAVLFLCSHQQYDPNKDIAGDKALVEKIYMNNRWYKGNGCTVKEMTDRFIKWAEGFNPISKSEESEYTA